MARPSRLLPARAAFMMNAHLRLWGHRLVAFPKAANPANSALIPAAQPLPSPETWLPGSLTMHTNHTFMRDTYFVHHVTPPRLQLLIPAPCWTEHRDPSAWADVLRAITPRQSVVSFPTESWSVGPSSDWAA